GRLILSRRITKDPSSQSKTGLSGGMSFVPPHVVLSFKLIFSSPGGMRLVAALVWLIVEEASSAFASLRSDMSAFPAAAGLRRDELSDEARATLKCFTTCGADPA